MIHLRLSIFCVLLCLVAALGQSPSDKKGVLTGDVADVTENAPLPQAFVYIHGAAGGQSGAVGLDAAGRFMLSLTPGFYDVFVAADGFTPTCKRIRILPGETERYAARLRADVEHAEQASIR